MESSSEHVPSIMTSGIELSVLPQDVGCVLELCGRAGQLSLLRRILHVYQHEFGIHFEKNNVVPELVVEQIPAEWCVNKTLKIVIVGAFSVDKPSLLDCYVKENFRGTTLQHNIASEVVESRLSTNARNIRLEIRRINTYNFRWDEKSDSFKDIDLIILNINATSKTCASLASLKEIFEKIVRYLSYPEVPLIAVGMRAEQGKLPRQEVVESFTETIGIPYVEFFTKDGESATRLLKTVIDVGIHKRPTVYALRAFSKTATREDFTDPRFYEELNKKLLESFSPSQLIHPDIEPRLDLYRYVSEFFEGQGDYLVLLNFHLKHIKSSEILFKKEAQKFFLRLEKEPLGKTIFEKFQYDLEQGSFITKNILRLLVEIRGFVNSKMYTLILFPDTGNIDILCDFIRHNEQLINLTLVFKYSLSVEELNKLGAALYACLTLRHLKFAMPTDLRIKSFASFEAVFESHSSLQSVNLSGAFINTEVVSFVKHMIKKNQQLIKLDISRSRLAFSELSKILQVIPTGIFLTDLNIAGNKISELGVVHLLEGLSLNPQLKIVDVSSCSFSYAAMDTFLKGLQKIESLVSLGLANNFALFANEFLIKILQLLRINKGIKKINLSQNPLLDEGAVLVADFLRHNIWLESIDLSQTRMTDIGLIELSGALHVNAVLQELKMAKNNYTLAGVSVLLGGLHKNVGLFSLDIGESVQCKETLGSLIGFIPDNTRLRVLGFMPSQRQRTLELLELYENAFKHNRIITGANHDFVCRCGRCLCVRENQIVSQIKENQLNRYKNIALLAKAYQDPTEDHETMRVFKKIPKDVLKKHIFKKAYPELREETFSTVSKALFFKPQRVAVCSRESNQIANVRLAPVRLNFFGVDVELRQENEDVMLSLSSDTRDYQTLRQLAEKCKERIHLLLPFMLKHDVEVIGVSPRGSQIPNRDLEEEQCFRVALMGEVASGKTIFAHSFVSKSYQEYFKATIGLDLKQKTVVLEGSSCKVCVYDLAGTRPQDSFTHIYLRDIDGIFLTVDLKRPERYEETYCRMIFESPFPNIPIVMVGLKSDISQPENIAHFSAIAEKLNIPCMLVSAKMRHNVDEAFDLLLRMIMTKKMPSYTAEICIKGATLDWFTFPRFYGDLNQLLLESTLIPRTLTKSSLTYEYYLGALRWLDEKTVEERCRFYIKNSSNDDELIKQDANENIAKIREKSPECFNRVIQMFHTALKHEQSNMRHEAVEGLRKLGQLHTQRVRKICLTLFERIQFSSNYELNGILQKINDYQRPALIQDCLRALSGAHATCFSLLKEMGAEKACEEIERRVLQALGKILKQSDVALNMPAAKTLGFSRK